MRLAEEDEARGRLISAGDKYGRAATYYLTAERLQAHNAPGRLDLYKRMRAVFDRGVRLAHENCERVEIPYGDNASRPRSTSAPKASRVARRFSSSSTASIRRRR